MAREKRIARPAPWVKDHNRDQISIPKTSSSGITKNSTKSETFLIRKEPLRRFMMEIAMGTDADLRVESLAVEALRAAGEVLLWNLCATNESRDRRVFLAPEEYKLVKRVSKSTENIFAE